MGNPDQVDGVRPLMAVGRSGGEAKEPLLVGESFVAAAAANRSMIMFDDVSCPPDPLRAPRAVLLFTGHLKGTCPINPGAPARSARSPKIDAIVNQIRWCREAFGGGCHAFLHTWSTLDKAPIPLDGVALARLNLSRPTEVAHPERLNLSQRLVSGGFLNHGSRSFEHTPHSSRACVDRIRAAVGARHLTVAIDMQVPQVPLEQARPWGHVREMVDLNMRMQLAGIGGGLALAARHVPCYDALVRIRADVGEMAGSSAAAWSKCCLCSAPARLLCLLRARLAALGSSELLERGRLTGRPVVALGARANRLQSRRFQRL